MPVSPFDSSLPRNNRSDVNVLLASGSLNPDTAITELCLEDGQVVRLSTAALLQPTDLHVADVEGVIAQNLVRGPEQIVVPLAEEHLRVDHRTIETGKVRLHKVIQEYETQLDEVLSVRSFDVERVILNQPVDTAPGIRHEGDTTIYPLVEEKLVLTRQLILKEELRVTRRDSERHDTRPITLRRETIQVEREPLDR